MIEFVALHPLIGVEVRGIDVAESLTDEAFRALRDALDRYSLLVFRDQPVTNEQQLAFSRRFGPLESTKPGTLGEGSELVILTNIAEDDSIVAETHRQWLTTRANQLWHSDSSFKRIPALASILSGREVPPEGGETEYASMRAAWRALSPEMQNRLEGKIAIHDYGHSRGQIDPELMTPREREALPPVRQTVVRHHPVTGEKILYLGSHVSGIEGMTRDQAIALVNELMDIATQPDRVYVHHWRRNDLLMWDNRTAIHRGRPFPQQQPRYLVRTTVAGDAPTVSS